MSDEAPGMERLKELAGELAPILRVISGVSLVNVMPYKNELTAWVTTSKRQHGAEVDAAVAAFMSDRSVKVAVVYVDHTG